MSKYYAGVGSRSTPGEILALMEATARHLAADGWILRSGHAQGADQAFERGAGGNAEVFLPWPGFESAMSLHALADGFYETPSAAASELSARFHPAWDSLERQVRLLHARNAHQILGPFLDDPVSFVICWTPGGEGGGGTGQAIRIAQGHGIAVFDLAVPEHAERIEQFVGAKPRSGLSA